MRPGNWVVAITLASDDATRQSSRLPRILIRQIFFHPNLRNVFHGPDDFLPGLLAGCLEDRLCLSRFSADFET
jgi:hypothetical protein